MEKYFPHLQVFGVTEIVDQPEHKIKALLAENVLHLNLWSFHFPPHPKLIN